MKIFFLCLEMSRDLYSFLKKKYILMDGVVPSELGMDIDRL